MRKILGLIFIVVASTAFASSNLQDSVGLNGNKTLLLQQFQPSAVSDKQVWTYFKKLFPATGIDKIYTTPYQGIYAVVAGTNIFYGQIGTPFVMVGHLFNPYTQQDVTTDIDTIRVRSKRVDISSLNILNAIVTKGSNNKYHKKLIIFEDPDCPYCRALEKQLELSGLLNQVDIYRLLVALPMHPHSKSHINNIYCTKNKDSIKVLDNYMRNGQDDQQISRNNKCDATGIINQNESMMRSLGINGTPTIVLGNGSMIEGMDMNALAGYIQESRVDQPHEKP